MKWSPLVFQLVVAGASIHAQTLLFPHIADGINPDGTRWSTEINIINSSAATQTAKIWFFKPDGSPKCITFPKVQQALNACPGPAIVSLQANEIRSIIIDSAFGSLVPVTTGWAQIEGSGGIKAILVFRRIEGLLDGRLLSEAAFNPVPASSRVEFFPNVNLLAVGGQTINLLYIGLAIANADPLNKATGEIQLIDETAQVVGSYFFTMEPRAQRSFYLNEIFDQLLTSKCYARIVMTQGNVSAIGLRTVDRVISSIAPSF